MVWSAKAECMLFKIKEIKEIQQKAMSK